MEPAHCCFGSQIYIILAPPKYHVDLYFFFVFILCLTVTIEGLVFVVHFILFILQHCKLILIFNVTVILTTPTFSGICICYCMM